MASPAVTSLRSCLTCKERKVRCDRRQPCSNCVRFDQRCSFPQSQIRRRRARAKKNNAAGHVSTVVEADQLPSGPSPRSGSGLVNDHAANVTISGTDKPLPSSVKGRLVVGKGGHSRLLAENAWANVKAEEDNFSRALLKDANEDTPWSSTPAQHRLNAPYRHPLASQSWIPSPAELELCWYIYVDNVDPIVRILHKPTVHKLLLEAQQQQFELLDATPQALLLAVCFAAIQSLDSRRCEILFGGDPRRTRRLCQRSVELALSKARLTQTHNIQVVQAFTLFLACIRRDGSSSVWALVGLALRIAMSLGLHCDGTQHGLTPFETEMRRRLWWELRLLDARASEDCGAAPSAFANADTRLPMNIDDGDLDPSAELPPPEREGPTEMLYSLLRFELCSIAPSLSKLCADGSSAPSSSSSTMAGNRESAHQQQLRAKEKAVDEFSAHMRRKYPTFFDDNISPPSAFARFAAETSRLVLTKVRLQLHFRSIQRAEDAPSSTTTGGGAKAPDDDDDDDLLLLDELFRSSVALLETCNRLGADEGLARWKWLLHRYTQWHAVSFVLSQLGLRIDALAVGLPVSPAALPEVLRRAWDAIEIAFGDQEVGCDGGGCGGGPWGLLECLRQRVRGKLDLPDAGGGPDSVPQGGLSSLSSSWSIEAALDQPGPVAFDTELSFGPEDDLSFLWGTSLDFMT